MELQALQVGSKKMAEVYGRTDGLWFVPMGAQKVGVFPEIEGGEKVISGTGSTDKHGLELSSIAIE